MKTTLVQIGPSAAATAAGRAVLCPEMNAAVSARHSRTPEGLDFILAGIDRTGDEDRSIDSVFRFTDFGHKSITDMVPLSIHIEGVSIILVQMLWSMVHTGGGQETSTRYCKMSADTVWNPQLDSHLDDRWHSATERTFEAYEMACQFWQLVADKDPLVVGITPDMPEGKARRLKNNFVFDRARPAIPLACLTNVNITAWGSEWIKIVSMLNSSPLVEARMLAVELEKELKLGAPRLVRHTGRRLAAEVKWRQMLRVADRLPRYETHINQVRRLVEAQEFAAMNENSDVDHAIAFVQFNPHDLEMLTEDQVRECMSTRENRYDPIGSPLDELPVRYGWGRISHAELRDVNRHRPGRRTIDYAPRGFYMALDQIALYVAKSTSVEVFEAAGKLMPVLGNTGLLMYDLCTDIMKSDTADSWNFLYGATLGTQFGFTHASTLGHLIYECELRTGPGVHYRYSDHYNETTDALIDAIPSLGSLILRGSSEPEIL